MGQVGTLAVTDSFFVSNTASTSGAGMIVTGLASIAVAHTTFADNVVNGQGGVGGALDLESSGAVTVDSCFFQGNSASFGGAVYFTNISSSPALTNSNATANRCARFELVHTACRARSRG